MPVDGKKTSQGQENLGRQIEKPHGTGRHAGECFWKVNGYADDFRKVDQPYINIAKNVKNQSNSCKQMANIRIFYKIVYGDAYVYGQHEHINHGQRR